MKETLPFVAPWMDLNGIMLGDLREKDILSDLTSIYSLKNPNSWMQRQIGGGAGNGGKWSKVKMFSYKINKSWGVMNSMVTIVNNRVLYI